jgi:transcriptional regulator with XRE-family HTH domain
MIRHDCFFARFTPTSVVIAMKRIVPLDAVIGDRVRALRLTRGLSQDQLAVLIEASADDVEKFETGSKRIGTRLTRIARALGVDIATLFGPGDASDGPAEQLRSPVGHRLTRTIH